MWRALNDSRFQEIPEGMVTGPTVKNGDGTFSVNSSFALKPALEDHMYQCVVWHGSWLIPHSLNITIFENGEFPPMLTPLVNTWLGAWGFEKFRIFAWEGEEIGD